MRRSSKLYEPADCQLNPAEPAAAAASTQQHRRPSCPPPSLGVTLWLDTPGVSSHSVTSRAMIVAMFDFR
jgi:hypothetical protein